MPDEKDRQYNGQKKKDKRTSKDLQHITHEIKDIATRIALKMYHIVLIFFRC